MRLWRATTVDRRLAALIGSAGLGLVLVLGALAATADSGRPTGPSERRASTTPAVPAAIDDWQTVDLGGVQVEVPATWKPLGESSCPSRDPGWAEPGDQRCPAPTFVRSAGASRFRLGSPVGLLRSRAGWAGHLVLGGTGSGTVVLASHRERHVVRRILASARPSGTPALDLRRWRTIRRHGVLVTVPESAPVRALVSPGICYCVEGFDVGRRGDQWWRVHSAVNGSRPMTVLAPTEALALVVADGAGLRVP